MNNVMTAEGKHFQLLL